MASGNSTSKRGFASMDLERQREIASKGGRSVPAEKRSFSQDRELASSAGRKGGQSTGTGRAEGGRRLIVSRSGAVSSRPAPFFVRAAFEQKKAPPHRRGLLLCGRVPRSLRRCSDPASSGAPPGRPG